MSIECKTYSSSVHIPKGAYPDSAGYDLWTAETKVSKPWCRELISLDLYMAIPKGYYGRIVGRSGLENAHGIVVHNETIDLDYRGKVSFLIFPMKNMQWKQVIALLN